MAERNVELARRGFAAALRGDLAAIGELLDPEVSWHGGDPSAPGSCHNRDQALRFMRQSEVIRGGRFELIDVVGAGDNVIVIMRPPSDGPEPAAPVANLTTFRDGKVIEIVHYPNAADALAAAGV
jgi:ketosteroid isomerase-like protein